MFLQDINTLNNIKFIINKLTLDLIFSFFLNFLDLILFVLFFFTY